MNGNSKVLAAVVTAFAGGFVSGLMFAPRSGKSFRSMLCTKAMGPANWAEERVRDIEKQLHELERQLAVSSHELSERLRERTHQAVEHYLSTVPGGAETWDVDSSEITRELGRMPRA